MTLAFDPGAVKSGILGLLRNNAGVQAVAVQDDLNGVHWVLAPDGYLTPHVVISVPSDLPTYTLGRANLLEDVILLVRSVGYTDTEAAALAKAVDAALLFASPTIPGYTVVTLRRYGGGQQYADSDGFHHVAATYLLTIQG